MKKTQRSMGRATVEFPMTFALSMHPNAQQECINEFMKIVKDDPKIDGSKHFKAEQIEARMFRDKIVVSGNIITV